MSKNQWRALLLVGCLLLVVLAGLLLGGLEWGLSGLGSLESLVDAHYWLAVVAFMVSFVILVILGVPVGTLYCLAGGYLFGTLTGAMASLAGATLGAGASFLIVRGLGGKGMREKVGNGISDRLLDQLEQDAVWYLILLRIIPFAPFFAVNAAAAMTRVRPALFILATLVGLVPTTLIYAAIGSGLGSVVEAGEMLGPELWLRPEIWAPLTGLVFLVVFGLYWHQRTNKQD